MKKYIGLLVTLLILSVPAFAQTKGDEHAQGKVGEHIPSKGPAPVRGAGRAPEEHRNYSDKPGHPNAPHVDRGNKWIGHETGRNDPHYHLDNPWEHGHFTGGSVAAMSFGLKEGIGSASGLAASTLALPHTTTAFAMTGSGILTRS